VRGMCFLKPDMNKNIASDWYEEIEFEGLDSFALDKSADNTADKT